MVSVPSKTEFHSLIDVLCL